MRRTEIFAGKRVTRITRTTPPIFRDHENDAPDFPRRRSRGSDALPCEEIGAVHMVANNGAVPVTLVISSILPACYGGFNDTILVDGPVCDGKSRRSKS